MSYLVSFCSCVFFFCFFFFFSVLLTLRLPRLGKRELILVLFVRLCDLCLFGFVGFIFLLVSGKGCGLWLWHSLHFSHTFVWKSKLVTWAAILKIYYSKLGRKYQGDLQIQNSQNRSDRKSMATILKIYIGFVFLEPKGQLTRNLSGNQVSDKLVFLVFWGSCLALWSSCWGRKGASLLFARVLSILVCLLFLTVIAALPGHILYCFVYKFRKIVGNTDFLETVKTIVQLRQKRFLLSIHYPRISVCSSQLLHSTCIDVT